MESNTKVYNNNKEGRQYKDLQEDQDNQDRIIGMF